MTVYGILLYYTVLLYCLWYIDYIFTTSWNIVFHRNIVINVLKTSPIVNSFPLCVYV